MTYLQRIFKTFYHLKFFHFLNFIGTGIVLFFLVNDAIPIKNSFNRFRLKKNLIVDYFVE